MRAALPPIPRNAARPTVDSVFFPPKDRYEITARFRSMATCNRGSTVITK
jgi:hypothetical protein